MPSINRPQVLLLGNGINRAFNGSSWDELMKKLTVNPNLPEGIELKSPMPLQAIIATNNSVDKAMKACCSDFYGMVLKSEQMRILQKVLSMGFDHIITPNYSYELESAALNQDAVSAEKIKKMQRHTSGAKRAESKYLLHTYNEAEFSGVKNKIWHIHGEARKPDSMIFGHYYYGNLLCAYHRLLEKRGNLYFRDEQEGQITEIKSWVDAFILGDVYVLGFGFDQSEFDLWWLLNRKLRERANVGNVYFYEAQNDGFCEKAALLGALGVQICHLGSSKSEERYKEFYASALNKISEQIKT